jgi:UDPglucose 6-dehydrogenase
MKICVIGLWHQGIVGAACFAELGHDVLAADHDPKRVSLLTSGKAPLYEPGLDDLLAKGIASGRLRFTTDVARAVVGRREVCIMFDTPVDANDDSDLAEIFQSAREIAPHLEKETAIYVTAQVPVGTCDEIDKTIRKINPGASFGIGYSPENLRLGQAIDRFMHPPLPVLGGNDAATLDRLASLLAPLSPKWERVNLRTAEMVKHALNGFLATSITYANELGNLCDEVGADGMRIAEVLRLEPRVGPKAMLFPGLGFAGGTLARDVQTLRKIGDRGQLETSLLDGLWEANKRQNDLVVRKLKKQLGDLKGQRIAVLGLTYKPDTSTLRRSASLEIIADIVKAGADVRAHDPKADRAEVAQHKEFSFNEDAYDAVKNCVALVLITPWPEYKKLDFAWIKKLMDRPLVIDTANLLDGAQLASLGFTYLGVGNESRHHRFRPPVQAPRSRYQAIARRQARRDRQSHEGACRGRGFGVRVRSRDGLEVRRRPQGRRRGAGLRPAARPRRNQHRGAARRQARSLRETADANHRRGRGAAQGRARFEEIAQVRFQPSPSSRGLGSEAAARQGRPGQADVCEVPVRNLRPARLREGMARRPEAGRGRAVH